MVTRFEPTSREFVHWLVMNIQIEQNGTTDVASGVTVLPYVSISPSHNSGRHRYIFLLFRQDGEMLSGDIEDSRVSFEGRTGFCMCEWALRKGFGKPIGVNFFESTWSKHCDAVHEKLGYMPPPEYRSEAQQIKFANLEQERVLLAANQARQDLTMQAKKEQERRELADAEQLRLDQALEAQQQLERAQAKAKSMEQAALTDPILALCIKHDIETRAVFQGAWIHKKFNSETFYSKRFCWIDESTRRFYWSKTEGKNDPKRKFISFSDEVAENGISLNKNKWNITHLSMERKKGIDLEIVGTENDLAQASDWAEVAGALCAGRDSFF